MKLLIPLCMTVLSVAILGALVAPKVIAKPDTNSPPFEADVSDVEHRIRVYREDNQRLREALNHQLIRYDSLAAELMRVRKQLQARGTAPTDGKRVYWLSSSTNTRHNRGCRWYEKTQGQFCHQNEGIPCNSCGG